MKRNYNNKFDLHGTLELLHTTSDLDVQVRLISILSAYVMLKDADTEVVITCNHIYDKLTNVLAKSTSRKAAIGLNFLSALLYVDEERRQNLAVYAKNMIRTSGCLSAMCDLFTSCIIYHDTWQALCRCLAETCRGVEANQSYCTHLVPMCIQRCNQKNVEAFVVLTSLLQNNKRNVQLFIDSNGESLFTREFLQYEACLHLLVTLVQSSSQATALIAKSNISHELRDFLQRYGPQSQLGQWATIILYHTSQLKESSPKFIDNTSESIKSIIQDQIKMVPKEGNDDTAILFQNVVKEILQWQPREDLSNLQTFNPCAKPNFHEKINEAPTRASYNNLDRRTNIHKSNKSTLSNYPETNKTSINRHLKPQVENDYSFSFLRRQNVQNNYNMVASEKQGQGISAQRNVTTQTDSNLILSSDFYEINKETHENRHELTTNVNDFKPMFASTPKRDIQSFLHQTKLSNITKPARRPIRRPNKPQKQRQRVEISRRISKIKHKVELSNLDKEIKNRSISARFFDAINESCTTLVKTVKNMFVSKNLVENRDVINTKTAESAPPCNYSFTKYMRKRDAVLLNEVSKIYSKSDVVSSEITNSCNTCNDTVVLKHKLANDDYLKNTVKKLKIGINLYGCDFKKISKTLWPQETYMTPVVLYSLYRKLIIK